jgi:hypothetical protein
MKIWRMRIACWITNATNTDSECVVLIVFPLQHWLHVLAGMLSHTYFSQTFLVYLFIRFAAISYRRFIAIHCKFNLSTYVEEPLVICSRGCVQREI